MRILLMEGILTKGDLALHCCRWLQLHHVVLGILEKVPSKNVGFNVDDTEKM